MGTDQSKPIDQPPLQNNNPQKSNQPILISTDSFEEDQQFLVQAINKIRLTNLTQINYYWIDPRIYNGQNQRYLKLLQEHFKIQTFTSVDSLKSQLEEKNVNQISKIICAASLVDTDYNYLQNQRKVNQVFLFCQNQERAKLLMNNFSKIKSVGYNCPDLIKVLKSFQNSNNEGAPQNTLLFMIQDDANLLNKYRLNYHCLTNKRNKILSKQNFAQLSKKLYPLQKQLIQEFLIKYDLNKQNKQKQNQILEWAFKDSFFWNMLQSLPKTTTDPTRLAYLRLPFKDLYQAIFNGYRLIKKKPTSLYIVIELNQSQIKKIQKAQDNFIIFTTFVKGFTDQSKAMKQFKSRGNSAFLFDVVSSKKKLYEELDFGYIINQNENITNVIFNIYNFFKVDQINTKVRRGTLFYGSLAEAFYIRRQPNARQRLTQNQQALLRNFDYLQDIMKKVKDQASMLQMSGYFKESLIIYDKKLEQVRKTNKPQAILDQYIIQKGDAHKMNQEFDKAEEAYKSVLTEKLKIIAQIRLIQLYLIRNDFSKYQAALNKISPRIQQIRTNGFQDQALKLQNYIGLNLMKKQQYKQAAKLYKKLQAEAAKYYDYKYQGIPLVHQIIRNMAACHTKLNNFNQALNLLKDSKGWQQACEGITPNLLLTQKMIQNVYLSRGDTEQIKQSERQIKKIQLEQSSVDVKYLDVTRVDVSRVIIDIQSSIPKIDKEKQEKDKRINIEQSLINIDI